MNPFPLIGALLVLAAALVVAGVALLAGLAWALIAAGACSALLAIGNSSISLLS